MKSFVIAGVASGVGKTTIATGLIAALRRRGLRVQPFKVGPDYIDPSYHRLAADRPSRNVDTWLVPLHRARELFVRAAAGCDVGIVEGVMGLYDGRLGAGEAGSTAHVAKLLGLPVVLVVDVGKAARSGAAAALGFRCFDPNVELAGVILNRVSGERHLQTVAEAMRQEARLRMLGWVRRGVPVELPERYLGLIPAAERTPPKGDIDALAAAIEQHVDVDELMALASEVDLSESAESDLFPAEAVTTRAKIAVAYDEAFNFYYEDNLDLLRAWGAELAKFSPLRDASLPDDVAGIYLGGGFPELFAERLSANERLKAEIRAAAREGMPIHAECGGLMYLGDRLTDRRGQQWEMVGAIPTTSSLAGERVTVGYRTLTALRDSPLARAGDKIRAHEFHWSSCHSPSARAAAYTVDESPPRVEGYLADNLVASYMHLHFATDPRLAPRFVESCAAWAAADRSLRNGRDGSPRWPRVASRVSFRACEGTTRSNSRVDPSQAPDDPGSQNETGLLSRFEIRPREIERQSEARIEAAWANDLPKGEPDRSVVKRMVYATGDPELAKLTGMSAGAAGTGIAALRRGANIVVDVNMVASGLDAGLVERLESHVFVAIDRPGAREHAERHDLTRSAAGMLLSADQLEGAVVAIGTAPTALLALLDLVSQGRACPALIIGVPVGFVAAAESKALLAEGPIPFITVAGTRGGSPIAAGVLNLLMRLAAQSATDIPQQPTPTMIDNAPREPLDGRERT
jgi:cobyrinic acid a,c-diamide synthase